MGFMSKMRDSTGVILWILVVAFGIIFMLQDTNVFDVLGQTGNVIGKVNGDDISLEEFNAIVDSRLEQYRQQTGEAIPPQMLDAERDRIFDELVDDRLRQQEMDRLGIEVADSEVTDLITGDNPHPFIQDYFKDESGNLDRSLLQNFIENEDARDFWISVEQYLRTERRREKFDKLLDATVRVSDEEVLAEFERRNASVNAAFVALRVAAVPDSLISYSDRDLRRFYDDHRSDYAREKSFTLNYVTVSKSPTAADTIQVTEELDALVDRFASAEDDSLFLIRNFSERPYSDAYFSVNDLDPDLAEVVFANTDSDGVLGPFAAGGEMHLVKIKDVRPSDSRSLRAQHILVRVAPGAADDAKVAARQKIDDIRELINAGATFGEVARLMSDDALSAANGGDLGWFSRDRMVKEFADAAFNARIGRIVGPVETQFGFHLIKVTAESREEVQLVDFSLPITASVTTLNRIEDNLADLLFFAETEKQDFTEEAQRRGYTVQPVQIEADQSFIPGIGNSRQLTNFLQRADEGDYSPVIELNENFLVAQLAEISDEGYRPFDEVRAEIEVRVKTEKKKEVQAEKLKAAETTNLTQLATAVGGTVQTANDLTYSSGVIPSLGREPVFIGSLFGLDDGEVSGVIEGDNAVFVIRRISSSNVGNITEAERGSIRGQLTQQKRNRLRSQLIASVRDEADIVDNRRIFLVN
ncbi:MAG: peptidylprolyl isomerase [Rhodothermales bacterium]|nr:peptidylprolyl isomerase [Rhodothermales bacterium]